MFNKIKADPSEVVSSRNAALEFWKKFMIVRRKENPEKGTHWYRTGFRSLLTSHEIYFPQNTGKQYGLSAAHDKIGPYAGVYLSAEIIKEIETMMLNQGDWRTYVWFRIGLRTAGRNKAISRMSWSRVYMQIDDGSGCLKLEQHETKARRGDRFLGEEGEWQIKLVPLEIKDILQKWKEISGYSKFLWFEDSGSDAQNTRNAKQAAIKTVKSLRSYYERMEGKVDARTFDCMMKRPAHTMRHTLAQQLKNNNFTDEQISYMFGWRSADIVRNWYTKIPEDQQNELARRSSRVIF